MVGNSDLQRIKIKYQAARPTFGKGERKYDPKFFRVENVKLYSTGLL